MSFDIMFGLNTAVRSMSQSLSSRAMSFDQVFENQLRRDARSQSLSSRAMSFDYSIATLIAMKKSLNPFRAGRCLSTQE